MGNVLLWFHNSSCQSYRFYLNVPMTRLVQFLVLVGKSNLQLDIKRIHCMIIGILDWYSRHSVISLIIHCDITVGSYTLSAPICDVSVGICSTSNQSHYTKQRVRTFDVNNVYVLPPVTSSIISHISLFFFSVI